MTKDELEVILTRLQKSDIECQMLKYGTEKVYLANVDLTNTIRSLEATILSTNERRPDELMGDYMARIWNDLRDAQRDVDELKSKLQAQMTPAVPTKPGWYWWREDANHAWIARRICRDGFNSTLFIPDSGDKMTFGQYIGPIERPKVEA